MDDFEFFNQCFELPSGYPVNFSDFYNALEKELKTIRMLIEISDRVLNNMTLAMMESEASVCFDGAESCLYNLREAYKHTKNQIIASYCSLRYKQALNIRTVVSKGMSAIEAGDSEELISKLFEQSKNHRYNDLLPID